MDKKRTPAGGPRLSQEVEQDEDAGPRAVTCCTPHGRAFAERVAAQVEWGVSLTEARWRAYAEIFLCDPAAVDALMDPGVAAFLRVLGGEVLSVRRGGESAPEVSVHRREEGQWFDFPERKR